MFVAKASFTYKSIGREIDDIYKEVDKNATREARRLIHLWRDETIEGWPVAAENSKDSKGTITWPTGGLIPFYRFEIRAPYAHIIEYGRYPGVGPKTARRISQPLPGVDITLNTGIYPTQKPSAPNRRAMAKVKRELSTKSMMNIRPKAR